MLYGVATIGENIKRWRLARGIRTQTALADLIGVRPTQVNDWERNRYKSLDTKTLKRIARVLDVKLDQLTDGVPDQPTDGPTGQPVSRSGLHTPAQSRVNSQGTKGAERPASLQGALNAESRPLSLSEISDRLYAAAAEVVLLAGALPKRPDREVAPTPSAHAEGVRAHGRPATGKPPRKRKAG